MYVLGISAFRDDAAAALLHDGSIVGIAEEERFVRVKHAVSVYDGVFVTSAEEHEPLADFELRYFPTRSIEFLLGRAGIDYSDVDVVAYDFDHAQRISRFDAFQPVASLVPPEGRPRLQDMWRYWRRLLADLAERCRAELVYVPHHLAHASGAVFSTTWPVADFLVLDGLGELATVTGGTFDGDFRPRLQVCVPHSLGLVYAAVTRYLGFRPYSDEQKTMGLAGYGRDDYRESAARLLWPVPNGFETDPDRVWTRDVKFGLDRPSALADLFGVMPRPAGVAATHGDYPSIACSIQRQLERVADHLVDVLRAGGQPARLCLAGGVALNSQMNAKLAARADVAELFVQPQAGDSGTALGAAYHEHHRRTGSRPEPLRHAYWGSEHGDGDVRRCLDGCKARYRRVDDAPAAASRMIADGKIVGWFQGRSECGPRALGNRSILASAAVSGMNDRVNAIVKDREPWRPFAASILDEDRRRYLALDAPSPFMLLSLPLTAAGKRDLVAAKHVDDTSRVQTVTARANPRFHRLIGEVKRITGVGGVLNTSFNVRGEPIVDRPLEALRDFYLGGMDAIFLHDYLVEKGVG